VMGHTLREVPLLIMHEIFHAVTTGSHGRPGLHPIEKTDAGTQQVGDLDCAAAVRKRLA
jgi:hypothetical protein